jgi:TolB-like protein/Tfp pilus assembly protein PilF
MYAEGKLDAGFESIGEHAVKNIAKPVLAYRLIAEGATHSPRTGRPLAWAATAALVFVIAGVAVWHTTQPPPAPPPKTTAQSKDPVLALPTGPRIAVLPFDNLSGDPGQDYFADGITEQLITELARFRELFVLARNTTFQYKGQAVDVKRIGQELGVNYVVEGSVRRAADTIRVIAQLIDTKSGAHLWAETYERDLTASNIFEVQDDITKQVVAMIASGYGGVITRVGLKEAEARAPESLYAYQCVLRAYEYLGIRTPEEHARLRACLERAVEEEPTYADAWAWLAWVYLDEFQAGFNARPGYQPLQRALEVARQAVELEPTNYVGHWLLAKVYFFLHDIDSFYAEGDRALALNPNNATMVGDLGVGVTMSGDWERGVALVRKATTLNPHYPGEYNFAFGKNHFRKREYDQALAAFQKINMPGYFANHLVLAYTYGQLGRLEEAHDAVDRLRELWPGYSIADAIEYNEIWNIEQSYTDLAIDGLRKAGLDIPDEPGAAD